MRRLNSLLQSQAIGVVAQVASASPLLIVSILIARTSGPAALTDFAMIVGITAILYSILLLGLRTVILRDRFQRVSLSLIVGIRICSAGVLLAFGLLVTATLGLSMMLAMLVLSFRVGDLLLDTALAIDQVFKSEREHLYIYLLGGLVKLAAVVLACLICWALDGMENILKFMFASAFVYVVVVLMILRAGSVRSMSESARSSAEQLAAQFEYLFAITTPLVVAQVSCAVLTAFPRLLLDRAPSGEIAGAYAVGLTMATLVGMVYYSSWLRWSHRIARQGLFAAGVLGFLRESLVLTSLGIVLAATVGGRVVGWIYAMSRLDLSEIIGATLVASVLFFAIMNFANLFKFSAMPWLETLVYSAGLGAMVLVGIFAGRSEATWLLAAGTLGMAFGVGCAYFLVRILRSRESQS